MVADMFELADRLVGIYKTENATKSVAINPGQFAVGAAVLAPAAAAAPKSMQWSEGGVTTSSRRLQI